jgi:YesN/AraC family two-component response regulator
LDEGLADYIMKPFDKDGLLDKVDRIMALKEKEEKAEQEQ